MKRILVTGGTGNLGKTIVGFLAKHAFPLSVLTSRNHLPGSKNIEFIHGDLTNKESIQELRNKFDVIVHCASNALNSGAVDVKGTQNLLESMGNDAVGHFIYISIVGVDKSDFGYYRDKYTAEKLIRDSGVPFTIIRSTQFHDLVLEFMVEPMIRAHQNTLQVPSGLRFQTIDIIDLARKVHEVMASEPLKETIDVGGPEVLTLDQMLQTYLNLTDPNKSMVPVAPKDELQRIFTTGINLCPEHAFGKVTWKDYLVRVLDL